MQSFRIAAPTEYRITFDGGHSIRRMATSPEHAYQLGREYAATSGTYSSVVVDRVESVAAVGESPFVRRARSAALPVKEF